MIRKFYSHKDEVDYLRRENNRLQRENEELRRMNGMIQLKCMDDLTDREKKVLEYIQDHKGSNKEKVIRELSQKGFGSRVTILKSLKGLERYGLISARKEKQNSQVYQLYTNQDNTFLLVYTDLDAFAQIFFGIIGKITDKALHINNRLERNRLLYHLVLLCHHVLGVYLIYFMLKWQKEISDKEVLNKLYAIVVYKIIEIQSRLSEAFKLSGRLPDFYRASVLEVFDPILQSSIHHMFLLDPGRIVRILEDYKRCNLHEEIIPLIDKVWKIGFPLYLFKEPNLNARTVDLDRFQNFRLAITHDAANKDLNVSQKIWKILNREPPSTYLEK